MGGPLSVLTHKEGLRQKHFDLDRRSSTGKEVNICSVRGAAVTGLNSVGVSTDRTFRPGTQFTWRGQVKTVREGPVHESLLPPLLFLG